MYFKSEVSVLIFSLDDWSKDKSYILNTSITIVYFNFEIFIFLSYIASQQWFPVLSVLLVPDPLLPKIYSSSFPFRKEQASK